MNSTPPVTPLATAHAGVSAAADALKKHGSAARSISRDFLTQRRGAIQKDLIAALQRVEDAKTYLTRMQGALADTEDLLRALGAVEAADAKAAADKPAASPASDPPTEAKSASPA